MWNDTRVIVDNFVETVYFFRFLSTISKSEKNWFEGKMNQNRKNTGLVNGK